MPACTVCAHPDREAIDRELVNAKSFRSVALRFGVTASALYRHKAAHIPADLARVSSSLEVARAARLAETVEAREAAAGARALDLFEELGRTFERVRKLFDACDRWLADPDDPTRYDLGPRAGELLVHYSVPGPGGNRIPAKATLADLLDRASANMDPRAQIERVENRTADPRELILKTARRLESELQLVARLLGRIEPDPEEGGANAGRTGATTVNVLIASPEWLTTRAAILAALDPYPEAAAAVARALEYAGANG